MIMYVETQADKWAKETTVFKQDCICVFFKNQKRTQLAISKMEKPTTLTADELKEEIDQHLSTAGEADDPSCLLKCIHYKFKCFVIFVLAVPKNLLSLWNACWKQ